MSKQRFEISFERVIVSIAIVCITLGMYMFFAEHHFHRVVQ
jgi:hypothetical protein